MALALPGLRGTIAVRPGVYMLRGGDELTATADGDAEFVAPPSSESPPVVWHEPAIGVMGGSGLTVEATVASASDPTGVALHVEREGGEGADEIAMSPVGAYRYSAEIPARLTQGEALSYCISVEVGGETLTFPEPEMRNAAGRFVKRDPVTVLRFTGDEPLPEMSVGGAPDERAQAEFVEGSREGWTAARFTATGFGKPPSATGSRWPVVASGEALGGYNTIRVRARSTEPETSHVEVGFVQEDGEAFGCDVPLSPAFREFHVPIKRLRGLWGTWQGVLQPELLKEISLNFGSWLFPGAAEEAHGLEVEEVALEYAPPAWTVPVHRPGDALVLFAPTDPIPGMQATIAYRQTIVTGSTVDATAWRLSVEGFDEAPNCVSARTDLSELLAVRQDFEGYDTLHLRARGDEPATTAVEVVLSETDGTPWGCTPELTTEWQDIRVPLADLRFFGHWGSAPEGRGGEGDGLKVEELRTLAITYGAWLYPESVDGRHSIDIEFIRLEKSQAQ